MDKKTLSTSERATALQNEIRSGLRVLRSLMPGPLENYEGLYLDAEWVKNLIHHKKTFFGKQKYISSTTVFFGFTLNVITFSHFPRLQEMSDHPLPRPMLSASIPSSAEFSGHVHVRFQALIQHFM